VGPNDFAPDARGGIYFTTSGDPFPVINGKVFYIAPNGTIALVASEVQSANGLAVSKDGRILYVIETEGHRLLRFSIGPRGTLSDRRVFLNLDDLTGNQVHLYPDGVKIDSKGEIYIGQNPRDPKAPLAGTIFVVNSAGALLRTLKLPSPGVPNLAFSPDEKTVYVTALDQLDQSPYQGKIYSIANE
jgi:gluconolactonase